MKNIIGTLAFTLLLFSLFLSCEKKSAEPDLKLVALNLPLANEIVYTGSKLSIKWQAISKSQVNIELHNENGFVATIASNLKNAYKYEWTVPNEITLHTNYHIIIINVLNHKDRLSSHTPIIIRKTGSTSEFTDSRDGQKYKTVKIGEQWWMAENFNFAPPEGSLCYHDKVEYCETYGRLYTFAAAKKYAPPGWHLPSDKEWKELEFFVGLSQEELALSGKRGTFCAHLLKANGGTGFNAINGGYRNFCADKYGHISYESHFWTSSLDEEGFPIIRVIDKNIGAIMRLGTICHEASSVRYIKN